MWSWRPALRGILQSKKTWLIVAAAATSYTLVVGSNFHEYLRRKWRSRIYKQYGLEDDSVTMGSSDHQAAESQQNLSLSETTQETGTGNEKLALDEREHNSKICQAETKPEIIITEPNTGGNLEDVKAGLQQVLRRLEEEEITHKPAQRVVNSAISRTLESEGQRLEKTTSYEISDYTVEHQANIVVQQALRSLLNSVS